MARFNAPRKYPRPITYLPIILLVISLSILVIFSDSFAKANLAHEKDILTKALHRSITQCYALEGAYPINLNYLKSNYGLTYNEEHFYIDYQYIGGNLRPDITIIERVDSCPEE